MGKQIEDLAAFVATTRWEDAPAPIQTRVKHALLDTIGVILAGSLRPEVQELRSRMVGSGTTGATVMAPGMPASDPRTASLLNAIAGRSVELCDGLRGVQPSVQIVPGIMALGETRQSSGKDLLTAFLLGYEVAGRLAAGFTPRPFAHPNGQVAVLACAAAGARLYGLDGLDGLDGAGISRTMQIATTMLMAPSYTNTTVGGTALNLPAGLSAMAATLAPELALAGYAAEEDGIEHALGRMVGAGFDPARVTDGLGDDWQIAGSYFRFYACCNPIHPALDCLRDVFGALRPDVAAIRRIDVQTYGFAAVMRNADPPNYFASKYSLPHAAAVLAVRGGLGFAQLDDSALADPAIAALRQKVHVSEDPTMTARVPAARPARVTLTLQDGRQASAARDMSWRDEAQPDPDPDLRAKFQELAGTVLTRQGVRAVEEAIDHAEDWSSVTELTALLHRYGRDPLRMP